MRIIYQKSQSLDDISPRDNVRASQVRDDSKELRENTQVLSQQRKTWFVEMGTGNFDKDGNRLKLRPTWDPNVDGKGEVRQSWGGEDRGKGRAESSKQWAGGRREKAKGMGGEDRLEGSALRKD